MIRSAPPVSFRDLLAAADCILTYVHNSDGVVRIIIILGLENATM